MLFSEFPRHPYGLHVHQVTDLFQTLMCHARASGNQLLVKLNPLFPAVTANQKPIAAPPLIGKLNIKSKILIISLLIINLTDIIPPGGYMAEANRPLRLVNHPKGSLRLRCFSDHPAIQGDGILPDPYYVYFILHWLLFPFLYLLYDVSCAGFCRV